MRRWNRTCDEFKEVREMIEAEDTDGIMEKLIEICNKYTEEYADEEDDDYSYEFSQLAEDMDLAYDNGDDPDFDEDSCDYYLGEFYDLCDAAGIWLSL